MPEVPMPSTRWAGPGVIVGLVAGYAALWFAAAPAGQPATAYVGKFLGAEAVLLLSTGLILISTLPWVEVLFDGTGNCSPGTSYRCWTTRWTRSGPSGTASSRSASNRLGGQ